MPSKSDRDESKNLTPSQACQTYLAEWKAGQSRPLEDLLQQVVPTDRFQAFRSLLIMEFRRLIEAGEKPKVREYLRRFPEEMSIIAEVLEMFPNMSAKDIKSNLEQNFEITGYGGNLDSAMAELRARDGLSASSTKSKSSSQNSKPESSPKFEDAGANPNRLTDGLEPDQVARSKPTQSPFSGIEQTDEVVAHIDPSDFVDLVSPKGKSKGRQPIMKLVIDWATSSSKLQSSELNSNQEMSPDSLYNRLVAKSILMKSPLLKPNQAPRTTLKRAKSSDPEQEIEEEQTDVHWVDNPLLLTIVGIVLVILGLISLWVFLGSSAQPVELPPAPVPAQKQAAPKTNQGPVIQDAQDAKKL